MKLSCVVQFYFYFLAFSKKVEYLGQWFVGSVIIVESRNAKKLLCG